MTINKAFLLEELNNALDPLRQVTDVLSREDIRCEDGFHCDFEFMMGIIEFMEKEAQVGIDLQIALRKLFHITEDRKDVKTTTGKKWNVEEVLKNCKYENGVLKLPDVQLNPKSYAEAKKWISEAGGKWTGGKIQGFTFDFNADRVVKILMEGKRVNLQQEFQFFETPEPLADWLVSLGGEMSDDDYILEPSAGRGAIVKAIRKVNSKVTIDCFELMPENRQFLEKIENINLCGKDFLQGTPRLYSKIFANPPFSKNQDVHHVRAMYDSLEPGGILCVITSKHWVLATEKICKDFREWLEEINAEQHEIPSGAFDESGTSVPTMAIKIIKQ